MAKSIMYVSLVTFFLILLQNGHSSRLPGTTNPVTVSKVDPDLEELNRVYALKERGAIRIGIDFFEDFQKRNQQTRPLFKYIKENRALYVPFNQTCNSYRRWRSLEEQSVKKNMQLTQAKSEFERAKKKLEEAQIAARASHSRYMEHEASYKLKECRAINELINSLNDLSKKGENSRTPTERALWDQLTQHRKSLPKLWDAIIDKKSKC